MHTNGPDQWGVYFRPRGTTAPWVLIADDVGALSQVKAREQSRSLEDTGSILEYGYFLSNDHTGRTNMIIPGEPICRPSLTKSDSQ